MTFFYDFGLNIDDRAAFPCWDERRTKFTPVTLFRYTAVTQFSSTDAQAAFPSWDEHYTPLFLFLNMQVSPSYVVLTPEQLSPARSNIIHPCYSI